MKWYQIGWINKPTSVLICWNLLVSCYLMCFYIRSRLFEEDLIHFRGFEYTKQEMIISLSANYFVSLSANHVNAATQRWYQPTNSSRSENFTKNERKNTHISSHWSWWSAVFIIKLTLLHVRSRTGDWKYTSPEQMQRDSPSVIIKSTCL